MGDTAPLPTHTNLFHNELVCSKGKRTVACTRKCNTPTGDGKDKGNRVYLPLYKWR
jgi:murein endopeptidase